jgi:fatty acid kinase fatty acid binding subunit
MKFGFVTDSTSDLTEAMIARHGIEVVPAIVVIDDKGYADGSGLTREEFYTTLPEMKSPPTTAAPAPGEFGMRYEKLFLAGCDHVLSFHPPMALTAIGFAAQTAANNFDGRVTVLDTGQLTLGLGFQVLAAAEAAEKGAGLDEVLAAIQSTRMRVKLIAVLDSMLYLKRSGRVHWAKAALGGLLHLKPIIELTEGKVESLGAARTGNQGYQRVFEMLLEMGKLERLVILHTNAEPRARQLLADLKPDLGDVPLINVTTVIGTHVGPNGLGFVAVRSA